MASSMKPFALDTVRTGAGPLGRASRNPRRNSRGRIVWGDAGPVSLFGHGSFSTATLGPRAGGPEGVAFPCHVPADSASAVAGTKSSASTGTDARASAGSAASAYSGGTTSIGPPTWCSSDWTMPPGRRRGRPVRR